MPGEVEVAMLTATFDAAPGSEEPLAGVAGAVRRDDPRRRRMPQRRPRDVGHAGWSIPGHREVGFGRRRSRRHLDSDADDGHGARRASRSSRRSPRSTSTTPSPPTIWLDLIRLERPRYFWRSRSTGIFDSPRSRAPVSAQISWRPRTSSTGVSQSRSNAASATSLKPVLEPVLVELGLAAHRQPEPAARGRPRRCPRRRVRRG